MNRAQLTVKNSCGCSNHTSSREIFLSSLRVGASHPIFFVFFDYCQHCLKYILLLLQIFGTVSMHCNLYCFKRLAFLRVSVWYHDELSKRSATSLDNQAMPRSSTFLMNILATTCCMHQPHSLYHLDLFLLLHLRSCIQVIFTPHLST